MSVERRVAVIKVALPNVICLFTLRVFVLRPFVVMRPVVEIELTVIFARLIVLFGMKTSAAIPIGANVLIDE